MSKNKLMTLESVKIKGSDYKMMNSQYLYIPLQVFLQYLSI